MDSKRELLDRSYLTLTNKEHLFPFLQSLANYVDYALNTSPYKEAINKQSERYGTIVNEVGRLEKETVEEMAQVRDEFEALVKKKKIDVSKFRRLESWAFDESTDPFVEFESYFKLRSTTGIGFTSDRLQQCLFDIAVNLSELGYKKHLLKYLVSNEEYTDYYSRINGIRTMGNIGNKDGNFIFSKKWPDRFEFAVKFERELTLTPLGSFVHILRFKEAYDMAKNNEDLGRIFASWQPDFNKIRTKDKVKVVHMAYAIETLLVKSLGPFSHQQSGNRSDVFDIEKKDLASDIEVVHNHLLQANNEAITSDLKNTTRGSINQKPLVSLDSHQIEFNNDKSLLQWNGLDCEMPPYKNEHYLCRVMFSPQHPIKVAVDWSQVFEEMEGLLEKPKGRDSKKDMKSVQDTLYALNGRVRDAFKTYDSLFSWKNKSVVRNF